MGKEMWRHHINTIAQNNQNYEGGWIFHVHDCRYIPDSLTQLLIIFAVHLQVLCKAFLIGPTSILAPRMFLFGCGNLVLPGCRGQVLHLRIT